MPYDMIGDQPIIYSHIPKCAGTSIKEYFHLQRQCHLTMEEMFNKHAIEDQNFYLYYTPQIPGLEKDEIIPKVRRLTASINELKKRGIIKRGWEAAFKFSFVRNPWDRFSSMYHYHQKDCNITNFKEFVTLLRDREGVFNSSSPSILRHTQTEYLLVYGDFILNFLGKYENLEEDIKQLYELLMETPAPVFDIKRRVSENQQHDYKEMYVDFESIYTVFEYYYDDVKNFTYTFDNSEGCVITQKCFERYNKVVELGAP